jgi:hypothetical protein
LSQSISDLEEFATERGFDPEWLHDFAGFRLAPEGETPFPGRWVKFPYPHMTGIWTHRYRRPSGADPKLPKYWAPRGTGQHLYNPLLLGPNAERVWLVEGEIDTLSLITFDVPAIGIAGSNGFKGSWALLYSSAEVFIVFDNDDAGMKGAHQLKSLMPHAEVLEVPFEGDLNDWMREDPDTMERWIARVP